MGCNILPQETRHRWRSTLADREFMGSAPRVAGLAETAIPSALNALDGYDAAMRLVRDALARTTANAIITDTELAEALGTAEAALRGIFPDTPDQPTQAPANDAVAA